MRGLQSERQTEPTEIAKDELDDGCRGLLQKGPHMVQILHFRPVDAVEGLQLGLWCRRLSAKDPGMRQMP
jgi:hypothetical protein